MVYLRTIISSKNEMKYIKIQLMESRGYVDKIIICEFDRTHIGKEHIPFFETYLEGEYFTEEEKSRIIYIKGLVGKLTRESTDDPDIMHKNERLFRGYFARHCDIKLNDIVIALDADEIIFHRGYKEILARFSHKLSNPTIQLKLYQFFYKPTYLWDNKIFVAPQVCRFNRHLLEYLAQWRYEGKVLENVVGCHFSWQLTIDEMLEKLQTYAHSADYGNLADREILEEAVRNKTYPFDPSEKFHIREINYKMNPEFYPDYFEEECKVVTFENA